MSTPNTAPTAAAPVTQTAPNTTPASAATATPPNTVNQQAAPEAAKASKTAAAQKAEAQAQKAIAAEIRKLKLKMDGQDLELPEEEVIKLAQQAGVSNKRFQEAAAIKKQAEQVVEFLKANPAEALKHLGIDVRKFSEDTLMEMIKREQESPEQKQIREQQDKLRAYAQKEKELEEARIQREQEEARTKAEQEQSAKTQKLIQEYDELFTKALASSDLPKNAFTVKRMAELQRINVRKGMELSADQLAKIVKEDYENEHKERISAYKTQDGKLDGAKLLEMLGAEAEKAIQKALVARVKARKEQKFATPVGESDAPKPKAQGSWREFQKRKRGLS